MKPDRLAISRALKAASPRELPRVKEEYEEACMMVLGRGDKDRNEHWRNRAMTLEQRLKYLSQAVCNGK